MIEPPRARPSRTDEQPGRHVSSLDGLRGLAALVVVVHHCLLTQPAFSDFFFSKWTTQPRTAVQGALFETPARLVWAGYEAVILFYVLSGLVLALPWLEGRAPDYRAYLVTRVNGATPERPGSCACSPSTRGSG